MRCVIVDCDGEALHDGLCQRCWSDYVNTVFDEIEARTCERCGRALPCRHCVEVD